MSKHLLVDMDKLEEYLTHRATEFQHRKEDGASFESLYLITILNRGYYWDKDGKTPVYFCEPISPETIPTEIIGDLTGWVMDHSNINDEVPSIPVSQLMKFLSRLKKRFTLKVPRTA